MTLIDTNLLSQLYIFSVEKKELVFDALLKHTVAKIVCPLLFIRVFSLDIFIL